MDPQMLGAWKLTHSDSDNFNDYMEAVGVNAMTRKMACKLSPHVIITQDGNTYTMNTKSTFKSSGIKFELDKECDETTADGREVKTTMTVMNGVLLQTQTWKDMKTTIAREVKDGKLTVTCTMGNVICVREYCRK